MDTAHNPNLATSKRDISAAIVRATAGAIPVVGSAVAEIITQLIPEQKLERVVAFVEQLAREASEDRAKLEMLAARLATPEGTDLLEDGIGQASRAVTDERRKRVARIVYRGVTEVALQHDRMKKLLRIHDAMTDSEYVLLYFYSRTPTLGSPWHRALTERYPDVLRPPSREMRAPVAEVERGAIRDAYELSLVGSGLLQNTDQGMRITSLGRMILKYAEGVEEATGETASVSSPGRAEG